jgi:poly(3-hydroxyalkanoate) synthetase
MLLVVAADDAIARPDAVRRVAATAGGRVDLELGCGHFDIYVGEPFATSLTARSGSSARWRTPVRVVLRAAGNARRGAAMYRT